MLDARLTAIAELVYDVAFTLSDFLQIDMDWAGIDSIIGSAARQVGNSPACHHRFSRSASLVDAGATDVFPLDEDGTHSSLRQGERQWRATLP